MVVDRNVGRNGFLRTLLTTIAILIILALTAALVAPLWIDWKAQKPLMEARLTQLVGAPVRIPGTIAVQFLPTPRLDVGQIEIRAKPGGAAFTARGAHFELAILGLMRGEYQFDEVRFDEPQLTLVRGAGGALEFPFKPPSGQLPDVRLDKINARGGRLVILDGRSAGRIALEGVTLQAEATSLRGPFRASGSARGVGGPVRFRLSTGAITAQRLPIKAAITEGGGLPRIDLEGALVLPPGTAAGAVGAPAFAGTFDAGSMGTPTASPWTLTGALNADPEHVALDKLDFRFGENIRTIRLAGAGKFDFGESPAARVSLAAKQIDIDQQFGRGVLRPLDGFERLRGTLGRAIADKLRFPVAMTFSIGAATLGGDLVNDVSGSFDSVPGRPLRIKFDAHGPAQSRLTLDGDFTPTPMADYKGRVEFATQDRGRFIAWAGQGNQAAIDAVNRILPFRSVALAGDAELSNIGLDLHNLTAVLDRSTLAGTVAFTAPFGAKRAALSAYLTSDALDVDAMPNVAPLAGSGGDLDLTLDLSAKSMRVASVEDVAVQAGEVALKLVRTPASTKLERLHIAKLDGASFDAHGEVRADGGRLQAALDAPDLQGLAKLAQHFLPRPIGAAVVARAGDVSPARVDAVVDMAPNYVPAAFTIDGTGGKTTVHGKLAADVETTDAITADLRLESSDAGQLLRQLGVMGAKTLRETSDNRIAIAARGRWSGSLDASVKSSIAGVDLNWNGRLVPSTGALEGAAALESKDAAPLLHVLGVMPAASPRLPTTLEGKLGVALGRVGLSELSGSLLGAKVGGQMTLTSEPDPQGILPPAVRLSGTLNVDALTLAAVTSLVLGPPQGGRGEAPWSGRGFAPMPVALPETRASLQIAALDLGEGIGVARDAALSVDSTAGVLRLDLQPTAIGGPGFLNGATLGGVATLRRIDANASVNGRLTMGGVTLDRPFARGKLGAAVDFVTSGDSPRALVAGLAGRGSLSLAGAQLLKVDPGAVHRVVAALDAETLPLEAASVDRALTRETANGGIAVAQADLPLLLAAGSLRFGPATVAAPNASVEVSGEVDLTRLTIGLNEAVTLIEPPADWRGQPPRIAVTWSGPWQAPKRGTESSGFFGGLSARALAINLQKLADFDADVRERAFFNHRLKIMREDAERERRAAAKREADERRKQEDAKRKADERAEDDRRREADAAERRKLEGILQAIPALPEVGAPKVAPPAQRPGG